MNYKLLNDAVVSKIDDDGVSSMSCSTENPEYLEWLAAGNTPAPADIEPPFKPTVVSMRQARLALLGAGLLSQVNDSLAGMIGVDGEAARIEWEYATEVRRESSLVAGLSAILGLTEDQLDDLFLAAYGIPS